MNTSHRRFLQPAMLLFTLFLISIVPATAEERGIKGKITDDKGQPIQDAVITIEGQDVYFRQSTKSDKKGEFLYLLGQRTGVYVVMVHKEGFQPGYKQNVRPELGEQVVVDLQLSPGKDFKLPWEMTPEERAQFKKVMDSQQKRTQFSGEVKKFFDEGVQFAKEGKHAEAAASFNKALEKDPKQPGILSRLGEAYTRQDKYEEALATFDKAIALDASNPDYYSGKAVVLEKSGKSVEAEEAFQKAVSLASSDPKAAAQNLYNIGIIRANGGKMDQAAEMFKQVVSTDPSFIEAYYQLGLALSGKPETMTQAVEAFKKYVKEGKHPEHLDVAKQMIAALGGK